MMEQTKQFYNEAISKPKILLGDAWLESIKNVKGWIVKEKNSLKSNLNKLHKEFLKGKIYKQNANNEFIPLKTLEVVGKTKFKIDDKEYHFKFIQFRKLKNEFLNNESKFYKPEEFPKFFPLYLGGMMSAEILYIKK